MREIQLTRGKVALVDDDDFERINQWKWCASRESRNTKDYAVRWEKRRKIRMHRLIMGLLTGLEDPRIVDHINDDGLDNRKCNLQILETNHHNMAKVRGWKKKDEPYL